MTIVGPADFGVVTGLAIDGLMPDGFVMNDCMAGRLMPVSYVMNFQLVNDPASRMIRFVGGRRMADLRKSQNSNRAAEHSQNSLNAGPALSHFLFVPRCSGRLLMQENINQSSLYTGMFR
ncbi:MAG TPA: hypothetical protein VF286_12920 [Acidiphilium sp.]